MQWAYGGFIRPGPINESLLIQREIYFHHDRRGRVHLRGRVVYEMYVRTYNSSTSVSRKRE